LAEDLPINHKAVTGKVGHPPGCSTNAMSIMDIIQIMSIIGTITNTIMDGAARAS
jgi:hypothetical protein